MSEWIEIKASFAKTPDDWSVFAEAFERFGAPSSQMSDRPPTITGYLCDFPGTDEIAHELGDELKRLGAESVTFDKVPEQDWSELWKIHFKPWRIGRQFVVRPTWEEFTAEPGDHVIVLDPGQAFGTGDHPTTRMSLELIEDHMPRDCASILDLGSGTGILAMAAKTLGAQRVVATDIDPIAVEVAKANFELNGAEIEAFAAPGFEDSRLEGPWSAIVSNIISATLIRLAPEAAARIEQNGWWFVSGIIADNWPLVLSSAKRAGFTLVDEKTEGDWVGAAFRKLV